MTDETSRKVHAESSEKKPEGQELSYNQRETVLVVDDEPAVVTMCEHALKRRGYRILAAHGAEEALRRSQGGEFRVALIDIMMPGMNGIELARILSRQNPDTKVIFMSGYSPTEISQLVGDYRHFGFIWKPFRLESLFHMVENVVARSSPSAG